MAAKKKSAEKVETLDIAIKSIGKDIEEALIGSARNILHMNQQVIPTSLMGLNRILGKGGFMSGRVVELYGDPGSGKTTLLYDMIKNCQKLGGKAGLIDAEHATDLDYLENIGINVDDLVFVQGFSGETNLDIGERLIKTGELDLLGIDSVTALIPEEELEAEMGDRKMALHARLMSRALKRYVPVCAKTGTLAVFINQIRMKLDGYGDPNITTGGNALKFYSSYQLSLNGKGSSRLLSRKGETEPYGKKIDIKIVKNKLAPPFRDVSANIIFGYGFDEFTDAVQMAVHYGVIEEKSKGRYYYDGSDQQLAHGFDNLVEHLASDLEFFETVKKATAEKANIPSPISLARDEDVEASGEG